MISKLFLACVVLGLLYVSVFVDGAPAETRGGGPGKLVQGLADGELGRHDHPHNYPVKRNYMCDMYCDECRAIGTSCYECRICSGGQKRSVPEGS
jgi:hypothetical protein